MTRSSYAVGWSLALSLSAVLFGAALFLGEVNQDEGWYLYAASLVAQGRLPYVDFASTQGPVLPFVYAVAQPLLAAHGLAGGRLLTALFGFGAALGAGWLAARLAPKSGRRPAALLGFALAGLNVYQCYFCTIVKTYSLAGSFLVLGFVALSFGTKGPRFFWPFVGGVLAGLAAGTRTSAAAVIPVVLVMAWLLGRWRGVDRSGNLPGKSAVAFGAGAAVTLGLVFLPLVIRAPQAAWFALVEYHKGRRPGNLVALLAYKAGFVSRMVNAYTVACFLLVAVLLAWWFFGRKPRGAPDEGGPEEGTLPLSVLWVSAAAVTAVHFLAPFPYDDYQVMIYPVAAAALVATLLRVCARSWSAFGATAAGFENPATQWMVIFVLCANLLLAVLSPLLQGWFAGKRDRIWWPLRSEFSLAKLQRVGRFIRTECGGKPGATLLTQDIYLAYEAGMRVPAGLELGPFSYYPEWSDEKAAACHVLNRSGMLRLLETSDARVAAFSGYGLSIRSPAVAPLGAEEQKELWDIVKRRYRPVSDIPDFGQADTTLQVLIR